MDPYSKFKDLALTTGTKKILITGALGQLGYGLARILRSVSFFFFEIFEVKEKYIAPKTISIFVLFFKKIFDLKLREFL